MSMGFTRRHAQRSGDLGLGMPFNALSSSRIVPRVIIARVTLSIQGERHNVQHSIVGYSRLPQPTPAPALMRELHWHRCRAEEPLAIRQ